MYRHNQTNRPYYRFNNRTNKRIPPGEQIKHADTKENQPTEKNYKWRNAKWTDVAGLIINTILAFVTYLLFTKTVEQVNLSVKATNAAVIAANEAQRANDISKLNFDLAKAAYESGNLDGQKRFKFDNASLGNQIGSIEETQRQFEIANKPILTMEITSIQPILPNVKPAIDFNMVNNGKYAAQINKGRYSIRFSKTLGKRTFDFTDKMNTNVSATHVPLIFNGKSVTTDEYNKFISGEYSMFFFGEMEYVNSGTGKEQKYVFAAKIDYKDMSRFGWIDNFNK